MKLGSSFKAIQKTATSSKEEDSMQAFLRREGEYQGNHEGMEVFKVRTPDNPYIIMDDRPMVCQLAMKFNWIASLGRDAGEAFRQFYTYVQKEGGRTLLELGGKDSFAVGMAFAQAALGLETEGEQRALNSVSAENAFYCLNKYYNETGDSCVFGTLISLLTGQRDLMEDGLVEAYVTKAEKENGMSRCQLYWGEPHNSPEMQPLRDEAYESRYHICRYLLDGCYNFTNKCMKSDQMNARCIPDQETIDYILNKYRDGYQDGKVLYDELCSYCEDALMRC